MALKNVCLVPYGWELGDYKRHTCTDRSHSHISVSQLNKLESKKNVRVIVRAGGNSLNTVVARIAPSERIAPVPAMRGCSCRVGDTLTVALDERRSRRRKTGVLDQTLEWAIVMLADIRRRPVGEEPEVVAA